MKPPTTRRGSRSPGWDLAQVLVADDRAESAEAEVLHAIEELDVDTDREDLDALALRGSLQSRTCSSMRVLKASAAVGPGESDPARLGG